MTLWRYLLQQRRVSATSAVDVGCTIAFVRIGEVFHRLVGRSAASPGGTICPSPTIFSSSETISLIDVLYGA